MITFFTIAKQTYSDYEYDYDEEYYEDNYYDNYEDNYKSKKPSKKSKKKNYDEYYEENDYNEENNYYYDYDEYEEEEEYEENYSKYDKYPNRKQTRKQRTKHSADNIENKPEENKTTSNTGNTVVLNNTPIPQQQPVSISSEIPLEALLHEDPRKDFATGHQHNLEEQINFHTIEVQEGNKSIVFIVVFSTIGGITTGYFVNKFLKKNAANKQKNKKQIEIKDKKVVNLIFKLPEKEIALFIGVENHPQKQKIDESFVLKQNGIEKKIYFRIAKIPENSEENFEFRMQSFLDSHTWNNNVVAILCNKKNFNNPDKQEVKYFIYDSNETPNEIEWNVPSHKDLINDEEILYLLEFFSKLSTSKVSLIENNSTKIVEKIEETHLDNKTPALDIENPHLDKKNPTLDIENPPLEASYFDFDSTQKEPNITTPEKSDDEDQHQSDDEDQHQSDDEDQHQSDNENE